MDSEQRLMQYRLKWLDILASAKTMQGKTFDQLAEDAETMAHKQLASERAPEAAK